MGTSGRVAEKYLTHQLGGYRLRDQLSMESTVFDEYLVRVHARDNHSGQIDAGTLAFQRLGVGTRPLGLGFQGNSGGI